jgi:hypothetical protein
VDVLITAVEKNPALNYPSIPNQCKIANGLGIAVPLCAAAAMLAAYLRMPLIMVAPSAPPLPTPGQPNFGVGVVASNGNNTPADADKGGFVAHPNGVKRVNSDRLTQGAV